MPSRKGQEQSRQWERRGDFVLDGVPKLTRHARQRMKQRKVKAEDIMRGKKSAGLIVDEATGQIITVIPDSFRNHEKFLYQQRQQARMDGRDPCGRRLAEKKENVIAMVDLKTKLNLKLMGELSQLMEQHHVSIQVQAGRAEIIGTDQTNVNSAVLALKKILPEASSLGGRRDLE